MKVNIDCKVVDILEYNFIPSYKRKHFLRFKNNFSKIKPLNSEDIIIVVVFYIHNYFYKDFNPRGYFEYIKDVFTNKGNNKGLFIGWYKKEYPKNRIFIKVLKFDKDAFKSRYAHII